MTKQIQKGFTLIELMIVVAIIGILAAVAIPAYQDYIIKAKLSKVVTSVDTIKLAYASYFQENGGFISGGFGSNWTSLGFVAAGPTKTTEISNITDTTSTASVGEFVITLANIKAASPAIDTSTVKFTTSPVQGDTVMKWTTTCSVTDNLLKKAFAC